MGEQVIEQAAVKRPRGFAAMDAELQCQIASLGGRMAHAMRRAHEFTEDEARAAGRKGGRSVSRDREHMARIGRIGGLKQAANRQGA